MRPRPTHFLPVFFLHLHSTLFLLATPLPRLSPPSSSSPPLQAAPPSLTRRRRGAEWVTRALRRHWRSATSQPGARKSRSGSPGRLSLLQLPVAFLRLCQSCCLGTQGPLSTPGWGVCVRPLATARREALSPGAVRMRF